MVLSVSWSDELVLKEGQDATHVGGGIATVQNIAIDLDPIGKIRAM
jgi:hypothetical protein